MPPAGAEAIAFPWAAPPVLHHGPIPDSLIVCHMSDTEGLVSSFHPILQHPFLDHFYQNLL